MADKGLEQHVLAFIAKKVNVDLATLKKEQYFRGDLGLSSLRSMQLVCDVEDEFKIEINELDIVKLQTVGQLIDYIAKKK